MAAPVITGVEREGAFAFTDVVESVKTQRELGDHYLVILNQDASRFRELAERFGGRALKFTGDGWLLFFDTCRQAVGWALEVRNYLYERYLNTDERFRLKHRIGIDVGTALVGDHDAFGEVVNRSKRIESSALPNRICMSKAVLDQVEKELIKFRDVAGRAVFARPHSKTQGKGVGASLDMWMIAPIGEFQSDQAVAIVDLPDNKSNSFWAWLSGKVSPFAIIALIAVAVGLIVIAFFEYFFGPPEYAPPKAEYAPASFAPPVQRSLHSVPPVTDTQDPTSRTPQAVPHASPPAVESQLQGQEAAPQLPQPKSERPAWYSEAVGD
jgi:class 3 adenylate cyclase